MLTKTIYLLLLILLHLPTMSPKPDLIKRSQIEQMLREGKKPFEIIDATGFSWSLVTSVRKNIGLAAFPRGGHGRKKAKMEAAIIESRRLKHAGLTYQAIALKIGVCRQRIQQYLKVPEEQRKGRPDCCEKCGKTETPLHCHHTNYESGEFMLLCIPCHRREHLKPKA